MDYIDLHVHSNASDGTLSPTEVVNLAIAKELKAIALTDHDTISGLKEARGAALFHSNTKTPLRIIPGTEISVSYKNRDIHLLGLFVDPDNKELDHALQNAILNRDSRNEKMAENLRNAGIDITIEKMRSTEGKAVLTRAHFAKYMTEHGFTKSNQEAFQKYLNDDSPYYVAREYLSPKEAITLIHGAKGLAILAHPLLYKYDLKGVEELVSFLSALGLDGIEAIYSSNTGFDEGHLRRIANKYGLGISGGSDFHGANKPHLDIGTGKGNLKVPYTILEELEKRL
ncbi:MAG: PHP domain-containing protein [Anaerocolumna sp.]